MNKLQKSLSDYNKTLVKEDEEILGDLGATIGGKRVVAVPDRASFVYVRLRTKLSELIQAFNDKVSQKYGVPVVVKREGNRYVVLRRNTEAYSDWVDDDPYLPKHALTHSFDKDGGNVGGDPVWVYPYQIMPALIAPFPIAATNVFMHSAPIKDLEGNWKYVGNTGTPKLTTYNPTSGATLVLISIDTVSGNPVIQASTGTFIPLSASGTAQLINYLPFNNNYNLIPDTMVRLVSGTTRITWDNLYDVRQFLTANPDLSINGNPNINNITVSGATFSVSGTSAFLDIVAGASGGGLGNVLFSVEGTIETGTSSSQPYLVTEAFSASNVYLYGEYLGVTGSTVIDINKNGVSLFTGTYPTLPYNSTGSWTSQIPFYNNFIKGDVLTFDIDQKARYARNIIAVITPTGGSSGGSLTVEELDGSPSVAGVNKIVMSGASVTDNGGGSVTVTANNTISSMTTIQTRTQGTYAALTTGNGTVITPLDIVFTPKKAGNKIILEWVINGECHYDVGFTVKRNGVLLDNSTNASNNRWANIATSSYDSDTNSTPFNIIVKIIDEDSLAIATTYSLCVRASGGAAYTLYLNRVQNNTGADNYEASLSVGSAMEINT